ncbi:MAG: O-methyltransferase [Anaerolineae bacterium]|nr:O-methyltransferase [Anaerolineae bacterium]
MSQELWTAVDDYLVENLVPSDDALDAALRASDEAKLRAIQVAPNQGKLLAILAQSIGARSILEIGTLGGYSTIWLARALPPDGKLITLEIDPKHAAVAEKNIAYAGLSEVIDIRLGRALETLPKIAEEGHTFDLVFIDADKASTTEYFQWALKLTRPGSLIIVDNIVRSGAVSDPNSTDDNVQGIQRFMASVKDEMRVSITGLQTVGSKGYDGFVIALVRGD